MKIECIELINAMHGKLNEKAEYYFRRMPNGGIFACRCPDRSKHIKTPAEAANQQLFARTYAGKNKKQ